MTRRIATFGVSLLLILTGAFLPVSAPAQAATQYYYAGGKQSFTGTRPTYIIANILVYNPVLDTTGPDKEGHSLVELAAQKSISSQTQTVEVGARHPSGAADTHLFVYHWINGVGQGYGTNFVQCNTVGGVNNCGNATDNWDVDDVITSGTTMRMGMQYSATGSAGWWIWAYVNGGSAEWLGYYPATLWTNAGVSGFTDAGVVQAFGEVGPDSGALGCTNMADGNLPSAGPPALGGLISSITLGGIATGSVNIMASPSVTDATKYDVLPLGTAGNIRSFRYGGPGSC